MQYGYAQKRYAKKKKKRIMISWKENVIEVVWGVGERERIGEVWGEGGGGRGRGERIGEVWGGGGGGRGRL